MKMLIFASLKQHFFLFLAFYIDRLFHNLFNIFSRKTGTSSLLSRDATSIEDELTQYTLTPTELTDSSASKDKVPVHATCNS